MVRFIFIEEPQPTKDCPRANGYFKHEDETQCDKFVNCIDGVAGVMSCPPGLTYDDVVSSCVWPQDTDRYYSYSSYFPQFFTKIKLNK